MGIHANAGTKVSIGTTAMLTTAAEYAADGFTRIAGVTDAGEAGSEAEIITSKHIDRPDSVRKLKGSRDAGTMTLVVDRDSADAGYRALIAAEKTPHTYNFRVELNDAPATGPRLSAHPAIPAGSNPRRRGDEKKQKIGKEHLSLSEIARRHGLSPQLLTSRVADRGMSLAIAVSRPPKQATTYTFAGKTMTLREWSRETAIPPETLRDRLKQHRWPLERALTEPVISTKQRHLRNRNAKLIARMLKAVHTAQPDDDHHQTGGQSRTSPNPSRTGVVSTAHDLHHHEGARP